MILPDWGCGVARAFLGLRVDLVGGVGYIALYSAGGCGPSGGRDDVRLLVQGYPAVGGGGVGAAAGVFAGGA